MCRALSYGNLTGTLPPQLPQQHPLLTSIAVRMRAVSLLVVLLVCLFPGAAVVVFDLMRMSSRVDCRCRYTCSWRSTSGMEPCLMLGTATPAG